MTGKAPGPPNSVVPSATADRGRGKEGGAIKPPRSEGSTEGMTEKPLKTLLLEGMGRSAALPYGGATFFVDACPCFFR